MTTKSRLRKTRQFHYWKNYRARAEGFRQYWADKRYIIYQELGVPDDIIEQNALHWIPFRFPGIKRFRKDFKVKRQEMVKDLRREGLRGKALKWELGFQLSMWVGAVLRQEKLGPGNLRFYSRWATDT
jgi:hypothetical protein